MAAVIPLHHFDDAVVPFGHLADIEHGLNPAPVDVNLCVRIAQLGYENIIKPIGIGIVAGATTLFVNLHVVWLMSSLGLDQIGFSSFFAKVAEYGEKIAELGFFQVAVVAPLVEEIIFRVIIQGGLDWVLTQILPDVNIEIFSHNVKLASLIALVASSVLFGAAHLVNGTGIIQVVTTTIAGMVFGTLKNEYGFISGVAAHMTNNALAMGLLSLASG